MTRSVFRQWTWYLAAIAAAVAMVLLVTAAAGLTLYRSSLLAFMAAGALAVMSHPRTRGWAFTAWVFVCVGAALAFPEAFKQLNGMPLTLLIVPLVQIIMFGMGTTLSVSDFTRVLAAPWPVFVGMVLQFSVMPVAGFTVAHAFGFEGELAAGIVLIGSCSGGVASNLITYLARGNVALSVTMTCISTLAAPLMTPLLMRWLAGRFVPIDAVAMMISILNMIIVPVVAGLLAHSVLYSPSRWAKRIGILAGIAAIAFVVAAAAWAVPPSQWGRLAGLRMGLMLGGVLMALVALAKLVMSVLLGRSSAWMDRVLPVVSMAGICAILAIVIAQTHDVLMSVGVSLVFAAMLHNGAGYLLGYWGARGAGWVLGRANPRLGIGEADCRTVAIEVGMQNGGMATGLAIDVLKSHLAALPPNVFGTWMNISGSMLANWWKGRLPVDARRVTDDPPASVAAIGQQYEEVVRR